MIGLFAAAALVSAKPPFVLLQCNVFDMDRKVSELMLTIDSNGQPYAVSIPGEEVSNVVPGYTAYLKFLDYNQGGELRRIISTRVSSRSEFHTIRIVKPAAPDSAKGLAVAAGTCRRSSITQQTGQLSARQINARGIYQNVRFRERDGNWPAVRLDFECSLFDSDLHRKEARFAVEISDGVVDFDGTSTAKLVSFDTDMFVHRGSFKGRFSQSWYKTDLSDPAPVHQMNVSFLLEEDGLEKRFSVTMEQDARVFRNTANVTIVDDRANQATYYAGGVCNPISDEQVVGGFES